MEAVDVLEEDGDSVGVFWLRLLSSGSSWEGGPDEHRLWLSDDQVLRLSPLVAFLGEDAVLFREVELLA